MHSIPEVPHSPPRPLLRAGLVALALLYAAVFLARCLAGLVPYVWPGAIAGLWLIAVAALSGRGGPAGRSRAFEDYPFIAADAHPTPT